MSERRSRAHLSGERVHHPADVHPGVAGEEDRRRQDSENDKLEIRVAKLRASEQRLHGGSGGVNGKPGLVFGEARARRLINVGHAVLVMCAGYRVKVFLG